MLQLRHHRRALVGGGLAAAGVLCLVVFGELTPPARGQTQTQSAELVFVDPTGSVEHVTRRLQAGFLIAQLQIPGARAMGRVPLADLDPALAAELERLGPGRPVARAAPGGMLVAQLVDPAPALLGETEYRQETARIGSRAAFSPTNADLLTLDVPVDSNDLAAVCRANQAMLADEIDAARDRDRGPPARRAARPSSSAPTPASAGRSRSPPTWRAPSPPSRPSPIGWSRTARPRRSGARRWRSRRSGSSTSGAASSKTA